MCVHTLVYSLGTEKWQKPISSHYKPSSTLQTRKSRELPQTGDKHLQKYRQLAPYLTVEGQLLPNG